MWFQVRINGQPGSTCELRVKAQDHGGNWSEWESTTLTFPDEPTRIIRIEGNLHFGDVQIDNSPTRQMAVFNDGNAPLTVTSIDYPTGFSGDWNSGTIAAGNSQTITVTFSPTEEKDYGGTITVHSNKTGGDNTRSCSGTGVDDRDPILSVAPADRSVSPDAGNTTFDVANHGDGTMDWTASVVSGGSWLRITSGSSGRNSDTIRVSYDANLGTSNRVGKIRIAASGATGSPKEVTVTQAAPDQPRPDWQNPVGMANTMAVYAKVQLNSESRLIEASESLLAAFKGDVCRGVTTIEVGPAGKAFQLQVFSNATSESGLTYKVWDAATSTVHDVSEMLNFVADGSIGTITDPVTLNTGLARQVIPLVQNWNWISFNVLGADNSPGAVLGTARWQDNDVIKGTDGIATFANGQWWGLQDGLRSGRRYLLKVQAAQPDDLTIEGQRIPIAPLQLVAGWNWLGYLPQTPMTVKDALASLSPADNDVVKQPAWIATYASGKWWSEDRIMQPGVGYLLKMATAQTLTYADEPPPAASAMSRSEMPADSAGHPGWEPPLGYANTMEVYARVQREAVDINAAGSMLAVFKGEELRGATTIEDGPGGSKLFQLNVFSNELVEAGFTFKVYDAATDKVYDVQEGVAFEANTSVGTIQEPVIYHVVVENTLTLIAPNGGEAWEVGTQHDITWDSTGEPGASVKLEYSADNGTSWNTIIASTATADKAYEWTVPNDVSAQCRVRITSTTLPAIVDVSDAVFTITVPSSLTLTAPNGGERWEQGTEHDIKWASTGNPGANVKLEYSTNNGAAWTDIVASTPNNGTYAWIVPDTPSTQCLVRVSSASRPTLTDASNAVFIIIGSAHHLLMGVQPSNTAATDVITPHPTVSVRDAIGSPVDFASSMAPVTVARVDGGPLDGTLTQNAVAGVATFDDLRIPLDADNVVLRFTSPGLGSVDSNPFNVDAPPVLVIAKTAAPDPVNAGEEIEYTITYGNTGLATAAGVVITETIPANTTYTDGSATDGGVYDPATRTITWNVPDIPAQTEGRTVSFTVTVDTSLADGGTVTNTTYFIDCAETEPKAGDPVETTVNDTAGPTTSGHVPAKGAVQVATDTLIAVTVIDGGSGVDTSTVHIEAKVGDGEWETISDGSATYDASGNAVLKGTCTRGDTTNGYVYSFQATARFDYQREIHVRVNARDMNANPMTPTDEWDFRTVMRSFGQNARVNSSSSMHDHPATAADPEGNIWAAWDVVDAAGQSDIYIARLPKDGDAFEENLQLTLDANDQRNPAIAIDASGAIYVAWEDNRNGNWDIYAAVSTDGGTTWAEGPVTIATSDDTHPDVVATAAGAVVIGYQNNAGGIENIWVATTADAGANWTLTAVTGLASAQVAPVLTVDAAGTAYVVWVNDGNLYGAGSSDWSTSHQITNSGTAQSPAIAADATGTILHLLWVDESGDKLDVVYGATAGGLTGLPLVGASIGDDDPAADQLAPSIAVKGSGETRKVFACWQDARDVQNGNGDTDIYFAETGSGFGTNIMVNDDATSKAQLRPALGVDGDGVPYLVWADERRGARHIYYAGATGIGDAIATLPVVGPAGGTVEVNGTTPHHCDDVDDVRVEIPGGALATDTVVSICGLKNAPPPPSGGFGVPYEFGPSGLIFNTPVTITIPHAADQAHPVILKVYWYDETTGTWSQEGISDIQHHVVSENVHAISFKTTHFSTFEAGGNSPNPPGGGGCAMSNRGGADTVFLLMPWLLGCVAVYRVVRRKRHAA